MQTPHLFADLRVPRARPRFAAASFADATDAELAELAEQSGFAGVATLDGDVLTWHHALDFQLTAFGEIDAGRVEPTENGMFEHALDGAYVELWRREPRGGGPLFAAERRVAGRLEAVFVVAGDVFMFARNRRVAVQGATHLRALVANPGVSRETKIGALDCEISAGDASSFVIERSTLPWREGQSVQLSSLLPGSVVADEDDWAIRTNNFRSGPLARLVASRTAY